MNTFQRIVAVVRRIPRGRVATYGQVARLAGLPRQARHVGYALHALPEGSPVPWHRVVNARGGISLAPWAGGETQQLRLAAEGIAVDAGRVPLDQYGWRPGARRPAASPAAPAAPGARPRRMAAPSRARRPRLG